jgi:hypothetical protein
MSAIKSSQAELEEKMADATQTVEGCHTLMVKQQAQNLLEEFNTELQMIQCDLEATCWDWELKMLLVAVEACTRRGGGRSTGASADKVKQMKFDISTSLTVFCH